MSDLRRNRIWTSGLTPEESAEVDQMEARCVAIDAERRELTAKLNRIRQRACQRVLAKRRREEAA